MSRSPKYPATRTITYQIVCYGVQGNAKEGWDVNDATTLRQTVDITVKVRVFNAGTEYESASYIPTNRQLSRAASVSGAVWDGDGDNLYAIRKRDGRPLGELRRVR